MNSSSDYSCEAMSLIVLLALSALSHFWFLMGLIFLGAAVWLVAILATRSLQYLRALLRFDSAADPDADRYCVTITAPRTNFTTPAIVSSRVNRALLRFIGG